jgi:hypothetical protein
MKRLHTGLIVFDAVDIICISFSAGSGIAFLVRRYKRRKGEDPIVLELKQKSPLRMFSKNGKPLKLPLVRGGDHIKGVSLWIKNKKIAGFAQTILNAKRKQKQLRFLQLCFFALNTALTTKVGLRFAISGWLSLDYTQFILIAFPSTLGGLVMGLTLANPLASVLLPLAILYGRGIEDIPDPYEEKCKAICKVAEQFHNKQLTIQMEKLNQLVEDLLTELDKVHLVCVEDKVLLSQRYKLKELIKGKKIQKRVQHFSEFIKKSRECDPDPEAIFEQIVEKIPE